MTKNYYKLRINGFYDGKQLGIPTGISGGAVLVNQGLADQIGIDFHTQYTWDDIFDWAKKVREYDDSMYLICSNKDYVANILANNYAKQLSGKTFINEETKEINLTSEQWQEVYTFVKRLYDEEVIAPASYSAAYSGDNMQSDPNWIAGNTSAALPTCPPWKPWRLPMRMQNTQPVSSLSIRAPMWMHGMQTARRS